MTETRSTPLPHWRRKVRDEIYDHVFDHLEGEVGGVLVGSTNGDGNTTIDAAIPALQADGHRASLTFTHEAWAEIHNVIDQRYPDRKIVGWYHSHPGFGIFLSEHDLFIHRNFFSETHQVAFVVDPYGGKQGVFGWRDGEVVKLREGRTHRQAQRPAGSLEQVAPPRYHAGFPWRGLSLLAALGVLIGIVLWLAVLSPGGTSRGNHRAISPTRASPSHHDVGLRSTSASKRREP
jgi:proteasome lid subunit RPN8/RPN11